MVSSHSFTYYLTRPKSTGALIEKLHRESIRLTQVQDIAGCRVIVLNVKAQERVIASLRKVFPEAALVDRRELPSYGYRAVHMVPRIHGLPVEIQIRTSVQHLWAELSEKYADVVDPAIKYGGGPPHARNLLDQGSVVIAKVETLEVTSIEMKANLAKAKRQAAKLDKKIATMPAKERRKVMRDLKYIRARKKLAKDIRQREQEIVEVGKALTDLRKLLVSLLNKLIAVAHRFQGAG